jgi:xanthine/CO dehydrogenase XdhC/CoxF family maturation factor
MERSLSGVQANTVTWLPGEGKELSRVILSTGGETLFASEGLTEKKRACALSLTPGEEYEGRFVDRLHAPQRLFVFGAGDDAKPIVAMAMLMGWSVVVADGRPQLARAERFPSVDRVVCTENCETLDVTADDAAIIMTHSYEQDRGYLSALLPLAPRYLGLLGARHRSSLLVVEAAASTGLPIATCCERIWAPVGLDLGGDGPESIALSIVSEVQAISMGKFATSRRLTVDDVARYTSEGSNHQYLETQCASRLAG